MTTCSQLKRVSGKNRVRPPTHPPEKHCSLSHTPPLPRSTRVLQTGQGSIATAPLPPLPPPHTHTTILPSPHSPSTTPPIPSHLLHTRSPMYAAAPSSTKPSRPANTARGTTTHRGIPSRLLAAVWDAGGTSDTRRGTVSNPFVLAMRTGAVGVGGEGGEAVQVSCDLGGCGFGSVVRQCEGERVGKPSLPLPPSHDHYHLLKPLSTHMTSPSLIPPPPSHDTHTPLLTPPPNPCATHPRCQLGGEQPAHQAECHLTQQWLSSTRPALSLSLWPRAPPVEGGGGMQRVKQQVSKWVGLVSWWRSCATPTDSMRQSHTDDPVPLPPPHAHTPFSPPHTRTNLQVQANPHLQLLRVPRQPSRRSRRHAVGRNTPLPKTK